MGGTGADSAREAAGPPIPGTHANSGRDSHPFEAKERDLGADVESNAEEVADASIDVHVAATGERELACAVSAILNRQDGRRQEWGLALSAMRMSRENPAGISFPSRLVGGVRVVAEHQRCTARVQRAERFL